MIAVFGWFGVVRPCCTLLFDGLLMVWGLAFRFDFGRGLGIVAWFNRLWGDAIWVLGWVVGFSGLVAGFGTDLMVVSLGLGLRCSGWIW